MSIRVTVVDEQTGHTETVTVSDGDYLLTCVEPCYLDHTQVYGSGSTHVLTVKGRKNRTGGEGR